MRRGFTLVEAISTVSVLAVLGSIASMLVVNSVNAFTQAATAAQLQTELSIALDRIDRHMRDVQLDASAGAGVIAPDIASVSATSITWHTDYSLSFSGDQVLLVENGGTARILLDDVTSFIIQTCDDDDTPLSTTLSGAGCDPIRRIAVTATAQRSGVSQSLRMKAFIRSTMSGAGT
jgi:prepilin-type N-terminal cleavage/methylation domain-containing protein